MDDAEDCTCKSSTLDAVGGGFHIAVVALELACCCRLLFLGEGEASTPFMLETAAARATAGERATAGAVACGDEERSMISVGLGVPCSESESSQRSTTAAIFRSSTPDMMSLKKDKAVTVSLPMQDQCSLQVYW